jgi:hypothetical protein
VYGGGALVNAEGELHVQSAAQLGARLTNRALVRQTDALVVEDAAVFGGQDAIVNDAGASGASRAARSSPWPTRSPGA